MITPQFVGALLSGDLSAFPLSADDAYVLINNRVVTDTVKVIEGTDCRVTAQAEEILASRARRATIHSMTQVITANQVSGILESAGIPALFYKGVALSSQVSGDWRGRESVDVDVLIPPHMTTQANEALVATGLTHRDGNTKAPGPLQKYRVFEATYSGLPVNVDLHWHVESPGYYSVSFQDMWERRHPIDVNGLDVYVPSSADMLLISALHGTREDWRSLRHLVDFSQLATSITLQQWAQVEHLSQFGPAKSLAIALALAEACGVKEIPAYAGPWARNKADYFYRRLETALSKGQIPTSIVGRSPNDALRRRLLRWQIAPSIGVANDALLRATLRQFGTKKRSWGLKDT